MSSIVADIAIPVSTANSHLERRVTAYLASRSFLSFRRLIVSADQGVVTLSGWLSSYHERQVAAESARRVAGVTKLVDQIRVGPDVDRVPAVPHFASSQRRAEDPGYGFGEVFDQHFAALTGSHRRQL